LLYVTIQRGSIERGDDDFAAVVVIAVFLVLLHVNLEEVLFIIDGRGALSFSGVPDDLARLIHSICAAARHISLMWKGELGTTSHTEPKTGRHLFNHEYVCVRFAVGALAVNTPRQSTLLNFL